MISPLLVDLWHAALGVIFEMAPWLLLGTVVAGLLHGALPEKLVRRQLRGRWGVAKAVLLGVPLPLCSCGVIPAAMGLKRDGASDGAAVGFLISTPQTGVDSILVSGSFLGWPFALYKVASAALTGLVGGWLADQVGGGTPPGETAEEVAEEASRDLRGMVRHSLELLRSIWRWLLVGVAVSAVITALVPDDALAGLASYGGLAAALAILVVALPLYVCATASVPIAAALVAAGLPAGAALVFLMAGPATNVATIGAVHRTFGARVLATYVGTLIVASVGLGMLFDTILDTSGTVAAAHRHGEPTWWAVGSALVLGAAIVAFAASDLRAAWRRRPWRKKVEGAHHYELPVGGMSCDGCARRLEGALLGAAGVTDVHVELAAGRAVIDGTIELEPLRQIIRSAGFRPG